MRHVETVSVEVGWSTGAERGAEEGEGAVSHGFRAPLGLLNAPILATVASSMAEASAVYEADRVDDAAQVVCAQVAGLGVRRRHGLDRRPAGQGDPDRGQRLRHPAVPLQPGGFVEIDSPDPLGARLAVCRNRWLAEKLARSRRELLAATEVLLDRLARRVASGRIENAQKTG